MFSRIKRALSKKEEEVVEEAKLIVVNPCNDSDDFETFETFEKSEPYIEPKNVIPEIISPGYDTVDNVLDIVMYDFLQREKIHKYTSEIYSKYKYNFDKKLTLREERDIENLINEYKEDAILMAKDYKKHLEYICEHDAKIEFGNLIWECRDKYAKFYSIF